MKKLLKFSGLFLLLGLFFGSCQTADPLYRDIDKMAEYACEINELSHQAMMGENLEEIEPRIMELSEKLEALGEEMEEKYADVPDEDLEAMLMEALKRHGCYDDMHFYY